MRTAHLRLLLVLAFLLLFASPSVVASADAKVKVVVYEGPQKCENKPGDEKLNKIELDHVVGLHFTVFTLELTAGKQTLGKRIESSKDIGVAPSFPVGQGKVIKGLDQGLIGLCRHAKAYIIVPPTLAYGDMGKPEQGVGPGATLRYDVEIVDIQPPVKNDFIKIDTDKDWRISKEEAQRYFDGRNQPINLETLWKEEDKNNNGFIDWEEFQGPKGSDPPPSQQQNQKPKKQESNGAKDIVSIYNDIDVDQDGRVSKQELANMFKSLGGEMTDSFWEESDPDGDGYVTFEEFVGGQEKNDDGKDEL